MNAVFETPPAHPDLESERRRAARALLSRPLLAATGETSAEYGLVRRHAEWLKQWMMKFPGWILHIDGESARLRKTPPDVFDDARPAVDRASGAAFSRRRYAVLCLSLAALERSDRQITLSQIAETIIEIASEDHDLSKAGFAFDVANYDHRRDLVHAVRFLVDAAVLHRQDGDEGRFLSRKGSFDVLYDINRQVLASMFNASRSPSALEAADRNRVGNSTPERADALLDDPPAAAAEGRDRELRTRLVRALLDDPVLYYGELSEDERTYFEEHRGYLLRQLYEATGLIPESRLEGVAMTDDAGDLTDIRLPESGADGYVTLLVTQWLAERFRGGQHAPVPVSAIEEYIRGLIQVHGSRWRREVREPGAEAWLARDALDRLRGLRLIRLTEDGVQPLAACARYASSDSVPETQE